MITIERFAFIAEDIIISASSRDNIDYSLYFTANEDKSVYIQITVRGREEFQKLVGKINRVCESLIAVRINEK